MKYKVFSLSDLFEFPEIRGVTLDFILRNPGDIPVYGGRKKGDPIGFIKDNLEGVRYFENCLGWNREGSVGYVFYHKHKFTTNDHHRPMVLRDEFIPYINLEYARIVIQNEILAQGFRWSHTAGKERVSELTIEIPINDKGEIDIEYQQKIAEKHLIIETFQNKLREHKEKLDNSLVILKLNYPMVELSLGDDRYFDLSIGKRLLKSDVKDEGIPAYSSNVFEPFGYVEHSNLTDFSKPALIWGIDGIFDWNYIPENYKFATTDHCGVLYVKDQSLLPEYLYYVLKLSKDEYGFDRTYRASLSNIKEAVTVSVPVNKDGKFDIQAQKEIVDRYKKILKIKRSLSKKLEYIISPYVTIM